MAGTRQPKNFKILLFRIEGKRFAVDISEVKKVIKEKGGNVEITEIEGAPPYIIGISEIEIVQNQKDLITFVDFRKIIDIGRIHEEHGEEKAEREKAEREKVEERESAGEKKGGSEREKKEIQNQKNAEEKETRGRGGIREGKGEIRGELPKRRIFMIISRVREGGEDGERAERVKYEAGEGKPKYIGILIDAVEGIKEVRENENATLYPPPDIKGVKEFFKEIAVFDEEGGNMGNTGKGEEKGEKRVFILNTEKLFEFVS